MSVQAPTRPELAGDDGSGDIQTWEAWEDQLGADPIIAKGENLTDARLSYEGWEERARDVQPGRGYEVADVGKLGHFLGDVATSGNKLQTYYAMPTIRTRRALSRIFIPNINR